jgi:hypothetical protein
MFRALSLIPSTALIEKNWMEPLVKESVVCFWTDFTIEASLPCVLGAAAGYSELTDCELGRLPLAP